MPSVVDRNVSVTRTRKMAEIAFSEDGKYFSSISQDGRLRIWDTETNVLKQEYTPDLHLSSPPSCLQWISVAQIAGPQKSGRRKSVSGEVDTQRIALGTTSGKILIYSVAQAKVETVLEEESSEIRRNKVSSLDWHRKYGLYSCNKEGFIYEWDLQSSKVRNKYNVNVDSMNKQASSVSAIKIVPHNQKTPAKYIITASTQIRVWRLHGNAEAELIRCLGHNAAPKALLTLASFNNTCWLVEGSQNERLLSFWDVTITPDQKPQQNGDDSIPNTKKKKKYDMTATPTYNFVLEDAPKQIDVNVKSEDGGTRLSLCAVTRSGVVHYYGHMLNGASTKPIKPSVTVQFTTAAAQPLPLQCCHLPSNGDLLLGYSLTPTSLAFERLTPDTKTKTQVIIRGDVKEPKKKRAHSEGQRESERERDVKLLEPMGGVTRKRAAPGAQVEVPMEQRLSNLTIELKSRGQAAVSDNLTKLLMQGLHSKDTRLLQTVLLCPKPRAALVSVSGLPADYVPPLLQQLAEMATRKTSQCASVCVWLSALLRCHAALLLATLSAAGNDHLTRLLAVFMQRRSHLCQLLNLKGRLELTISQREQKDDKIAHQPVLQYNDSSSEEEVEMERAQSSSEQSWADSDSERGGRAGGGGGAGRGGTDDSDGD